MSKWRWISHTLNKGYQSTERQALDWKLQGARRKEDRNCRELEERKTETSLEKDRFEGSRKIAYAATRPNLFYNDVFLTDCFNNHNFSKARQ